jgi:hypothetical protein
MMDIRFEQSKRLKKGFNVEFKSGVLKIRNGYLILKDIDKNISYSVDIADIVKVMHDEKLNPESEDDRMDINSEFQDIELKEIIEALTKEVNKLRKQNEKLVEALEKTLEWVKYSKINLVEYGKFRNLMKEVKGDG